MRRPGNPARLRGQGGSVTRRYRKGPSAPPWGTPLPGSRKGVRPPPVRTVYLRVRM